VSINLGNSLEDFMRRRLWVRAATVALLGIVAGCHSTVNPMHKTGAEGDSERYVVFDSGRGTGQYDSMTYLRYVSEISFTPDGDILAEAIVPQINYCNGACGFVAWIRDANYRPIASEAGMVDGETPIPPLFPDRGLDAPAHLVAGSTYVIHIEVWTTKSVGIYTTGARTDGIVGAAHYAVLSAGNECTSYFLDRGGIAFQLLGSRVRPTQRVAAR
jgi:hypothetical protein